VQHVKGQPVFANGVDPAETLRPIVRMLKNTKIMTTQNS
jgi:hypothetical protein